RCLQRRGSERGDLRGVGRTGASAVDLECDVKHGGADLGLKAQRAIAAGEHRSSLGVLAQQLARLGAPDAAQTRRVIAELDGELATSQIDDRDVECRTSW